MCTVPSFFCRKTIDNLREAEIGKNRIDKDGVLPYTILCVAVRPARLIRGVAQFG